MLWMAAVTCGEKKNSFASTDNEDTVEHSPSRREDKCPCLMNNAAVVDTLFTGKGDNHRFSSYYAQNMHSDYMMLTCALHFDGEL